MGRPLNKKYFGNKNFPYTDFQGITNPDSGSGGGSVSSIAIGGTNTNKTAIPAIVIAAPTLPGGVQAVARAHMEIESIINFTAGSGYVPAQVLTLTGGTGTKGTITVNTTSVATLTVSVGFAGTGYTTGDVVTIQGGTGTLATATVIAAAGEVTGFSTFTPGSYTVNPGTLSGAATVKTGGTGDDTLKVDIAMGVGTVTLTTAGDYTTLPADISIVGHSGAGGALFNLDFKVKSVEVTTAGSGYISAPSITTQGGTTFTATVTGVGSAGIIATAFILGGSALAADIIKQVNDRRYKVETADGVGVCELVTNGAPNAEGEMTIKATDSDGGTYYVAKLTSRKVILVPDTGTQFASGTAARWSLTTAIEDKQVIIENA